MLRNLQQMKGLGIAATGYLTVALSAALLVIAHKVGQLAALPRGVYILPMLVGLAGVAAGFVVGAGGIVITWASFGGNKVQLGWIASKIPHLQRRLSKLIFKLGAGFVVAAIAFGVVAHLGLNVFRSISGVTLLVAVSLMYLGGIAKLMEFLATDLARAPEG